MSRSPLTAIVVILVVAAGVMQLGGPQSWQSAVPMAEPVPKVEPAPLPPKDAKPAQVRPTQATFVPAPLAPDGQKVSLWLPPRNDDGLPNQDMVNKPAPGNHRKAKDDPHKEPFELPVFTTRVEPLPAQTLPWYYSEKFYYGVVGLIVGAALGALGCFLYLTRGA